MVSRRTLLVQALPALGTLFVLAGCGATGPSGPVQTAEPSTTSATIPASASGTVTPKPTSAPDPAAAAVQTVTPSGTTAPVAASSLTLSPSPVLATAAVQSAGAATTTMPTDSSATLAATVVVPSADEATRRITVPPGFVITVFAEGLDGARMLAFGPDGSLYVSLLDAGKIARLTDSGHRGVSDSGEVVATGLNLPHGLEWRDGWLYVAENDKVERLRDSNKSGQLSARELVTDNLPSGGGHRTRTLHFGPDGKLYVSAGSSCNLCEEADPRRAAILRFNQDGSIPSDNPLASDSDSRKRALWGWGLRNAVDFVWTPDGQLWADPNGSDGLGDELPPEQVVIPVLKGRSAGWPYCYTPGLGANLPPNQKQQVHDSRLPLPAGFDCSQAVPALFTDTAHQAPLGMTWAKGSGFPAAYQPDLLIAYHGSWNTTSVSARQAMVRRIIIQNGLPVGGEEFATGWTSSGTMAGDSSNYGRPVGLAIGPDGALYIADDAGGRVYRVAYTGRNAG